MQAARKVVAEGNVSANALREESAAWRAASGLGLAELLAGGSEARWHVRVGTFTLEAEVDPSVDPAFLEECRRDGRRVLITGGARPLIVGALQARRALEIDREGRVNAEVESFHIKATSEVTLQTAAAFIQLKAEEIELYGERVLTRARGLAKTLARMISLN